MVALLPRLTVILLFSLTRKLFNKETALLALAIYATNAQINFYDRTTAPSSLVFFACLLILYIIIKIRKGSIWLFPFLMLIIFSAIIHLHPVIIAFIPFIAFLWKHWGLPKPSFSQIIASIFAVLIVISPLILFDFRHNFLNTKGILLSLQQHSNEAYFFPLKILVTLRIQVQNFAALFPGGNIMSYVVALTALFLFFKLSNKAKKIFIGLWIVIPASVFSFYSRHIPEYYLLPSLPAFVIISAVTIEKIYKKYSKAIAFAGIFIIIFTNLQKILTSYNPFSLLYKQQAVEFVKHQAGSKTAVSFDTDLGLNSGLRFLLEKEGIRIADSENPPTHTIIMPEERRISPRNEFVFGGIKVIQSQSAQGNK